MKFIKSVILAIVLLSGAVSCSNKKLAADQIELTGIIREQGVTTYQYGTHILTSNDMTYALRSKAVDLSIYLDQKVTLIGKKVDGYPIEGGPEFIEVLKIR